ncbi:hypothetical protein Bbelb_039070 [Branchiostoma belcheri]|nr:hypothetical protein Bbelb_039070 [Branchiostoma belcheri]
MASSAKSTKAAIMILSVYLTFPREVVSPRGVLTRTRCQTFRRDACKDTTCPDILKPADNMYRRCIVCSMSDFESFRLLVCNIQPSTLSLKLTETTSTNLSGSLGPGDILQNIRFLDIRGVNLTALAPSGLVRFKTLEWLRIRQTSLSYLARGGFNGLSNVLQLNASSNEISSIHSGAFQGLVRTNALDLSHNQLVKVEQHYFEKLEMLLALDLSYNRIEIIDKGSFQNRSLGTLCLRGNRLKRVESQWFFGIRRMNRLILDKNLITVIEQDAFRSLEGLFDLDLKDNPLTVLWESWVRGIRMKLLLFWKGTRLRCTCANRWFATRGRSSFTLIPSSLPCHYPLEMEGKYIFSVPTNDLPCPSPVVKITQDIGDHDLHIRCQATWEEESSIFWVLPDNTTILLPGLGEDERNANLTSQHFNISFQHDISACGWTWETPSRVTTNCSHNQAAPNYGVRTASVLAVDGELAGQWQGGSIQCGVKSSTSTIEAGIHIPDNFIAPHVVHELATSERIRTSTPTHSTVVNTKAHTHPVVVFLPTRVQTYLNLNWYVFVPLCTVPILVLFAVCISLRSKYNDYIDEHVMAELRSNNQPGNAPENQSDGATTDSTSIDPYYSTIKDEDLDETVSPYGIAKAGAQYGRGKKRSRSVGENAIAGPKSRSEQCKCYNQTDGEDTIPDNGDTEERDAS